MSNKHGSNWIRRKRRLALYKRDGHRCVYCTVAPHVLTLDHLRARADGGDNTDGNLVTCCHSCNSSRGALSLGAWLQKLARKGHDCTAILLRLPPLGVL